MQALKDIYGQVDYTRRGKTYLPTGGLYLAPKALFMSRWTIPGAASLIYGQVDYTRLCKIYLWAGGQCQALSLIHASYKKRDDVTEYIIALILEILKYAHEIRFSHYFRILILYNSMLHARQSSKTLQANVHGIALSTNVHGIALSANVHGIALAANVHGIALPANVHGIALSANVHGIIIIV